MSLPTALSLILCVPCLAPGSAPARTPIAQTPSEKPEQTPEKGPPAEKETPKPTAQNKEKGQKGSQDDAKTPAIRDLKPEQAWELAASEQKMSIVFCLSKEKDSVRFERETLADPKVQAWLRRHTISTRVRQANVGEKTWLDRFGINSFPTAILRAPDARMLDTMMGFQGPDEFLRLLENMQRAISVTEKPTGEAAKDPYTWLAYGNYLAGRGIRPEESAEALFWCYDEGPKYDKEFLPNNLDFLLRRMTHLSHFSEEVKEGVRARRDALHNRVLSLEATEFDAHVLSRFGLWMRDQDDPMRAFRRLPKDNPKAQVLREALLWNNLERLVAYRHYDEILACIAKPQEAIASRFLAIEIQSKRDQPVQVDSDMPRPPGVADETPESKESKTERPEDRWPKTAPARPIPGVSMDPEDACYDAALLFESLLSMGRGTEAQALMEMATDYQPNSTVYGFFIQKACRVEAYTLAEEIANRGYERVPEREIPRVQGMLRRGKRSKR